MNAGVRWPVFPACATQSPPLGWVTNEKLSVSLQLIPKKGNFLCYAKAGSAQRMPRNILPYTELAQTTFDGLIFYHIERQAGLP